MKDLSEGLEDTTLSATASGFKYPPTYAFATSILVLQKATMRCQVMPARVMRSIRMCHTANRQRFLPLALLDMTEVPDETR